MKAIFITYGQTLTEPIQDILDSESIRGFTRWDETFGRGSNKGEPHYGTHAWPTKNACILSIVSDEEAERLMPRLRQLNEKAEAQGLSAFVWNVEGQL